MKDPAYIAAHIRRVLEDGGSAPHGQEKQRFFREEVATRGWRTPELRQLALRFRKVLLAEHGLDYALQVADQLFRGDVLEEKSVAVEILRGSVAKFGDREFRLFDGWLERVSNWADHDALVMYLIGPMLANQPARASCVAQWARSNNRWRRRAAAVALIRGVRKRIFLAEAKRAIRQLARDEDYIVRKGVVWLRREMSSKLEI